MVSGFINGAVKVDVLPQSQANLDLSTLLIQTQTASASSSLVFTIPTATSPLTYQSFRFVLRNLVPAANDTFQMTFSTDGGSTWIATAYTSGFIAIPYNSTTTTNSNATTSIRFSANMPSANAFGFNADIRCHGLKGTAGLVTVIEGTGNYVQLFDSIFRQTRFAAEYGSGLINAVRFNTVAGNNITSGTITLYAELG